MRFVLRRLARAACSRWHAWQYQPARNRRGSLRNVLVVAGASPLLFSRFWRAAAASMSPAHQSFVPAQWYQAFTGLFDLMRRVIGFASVFRYSGGAAAAGANTLILLAVLDIFQDRRGARRPTQQPPPAPIIPTLPCLLYLARQRFLFSAQRFAD